MSKLIYLSGQWIVLFVAVMLFFPACQDDEMQLDSEYSYAKDQEVLVPVAWNKLWCEIDRYAQGYRPGPAPRALAYFNLAAYEACMQGMPDFHSVAGLYSGLSMPQSKPGEAYHWPTVANAVYATMIKNFIPTGVIMPDQQNNLQFKIQTLEDQFYDEFEAQVPTSIFNRSRQHGTAVANAVWEWSKTDQVAHDAYLNPRPGTYTPPSGPGLWQPTPPDYGKAMFPYWGNARTFAISEADKLAKPPVQFSESPNSSFFAQALQVYNTVAEQGFTNQWIAEFWSDDALGVAMSPPTRWIAITNQVLEKEAEQGKANLELALYTYAKVSVALNDAGVACWYSKYYYNVERPVSYIRRVLDPNWNVHYLGFTPSFPAYPSGHSTFGAAAAEVLSHIFGYDYNFTDYTHQNRPDFYGMPRTFASFREAAEENAYSRIPLGVHFRMDSEEGVRHGYLVGGKVNGMPFKK